MHANPIWRQHPKLQGRFNATAPDDVQVVVHDGGPRVTKASPELVWVRISGCAGDVFSGAVLNKPKQLKTVRQGSVIRFIAPAGGQHLVMVTEQYQRERGSWSIRACDKCGLDELFDPPSTLIRVIFPKTPQGALVDMFTSFCPMCRGVQVVSLNEGATPPMPPASAASVSDKPWWRFW